MILINLLPPELRKRKTDFHFNPIMAGAVVGLALSILAVLGFFWLKSEVTASTRLLVTKKAELTKKTAEAAVVTEKKGQIAKFENRRDALAKLLGAKMYWARTLDEWATMVTGDWSQAGFTVSAKNLTISQVAVPRRAGNAQEEVRASFRWEYKIMGEDRQKSGDYVNSFFKTIEKGKFWSSQGFDGKPDDLYTGDRPSFIEKIKRVIVVGSLDWQRVKVIDVKKSGAKPPQGG
jgi:hypothetical protein